MTTNAELFETAQTLMPGGVSSRCGPTGPWEAPRCPWSRAMAPG